MGRREVARKGSGEVKATGILPPDSACLSFPKGPASPWPSGLCALVLAPTLGRPPTAPAQQTPRPLPRGRPGRPRSSPVLWKPRHTGAGRPDSPPGVRRGHALPGPGARRRGFPARRGEPAPFYSRRREASPSPRLGPPPPCPAPPRGDGARARAQGPWPRALRSALLAPLHRASPAAAAGAAGAQRAAALGPSPAGPGARPGTRGRGRAGAPSGAAKRPPFLPGKGQGARFAPLRAGRSLLWRLPPNPCAGGSPLRQARLQRETRSHALPPLRWLLDARLSRPPDSACREGGSALLPPPRAACGGQGGGGEPRGSLLREAGGHLGRGRDSTAGERRASRSQMGTQEKGTQLPEGMRARES
ncbi:basic proline-rich protein-like isoform X1 [Leopardus geoffroyi]|uniref:basic proline-rich protein-like isoform X1 n=1 Tax=Leopardus geoffroyi TaxID=46844 RepID=UPI001E264B2C|nr:basic proline-rich protein-like isoform X1 [Leopardus geoffroyi]